MRVLVCGGREFSDRMLLGAVLSRFQKDRGLDVLIEGNAPGADRMAGYWARKHRIENLKFPADWKAHGRAAGPMRNQKMLIEGRPDIVIAFPGGKGTADMVDRARRNGIVVIEVKA